MHQSFASNHKKLSLVISLLLIASFIVKLVKATIANLQADPLNSFGYSELLINYEGGFVRRGLLGEGIFKIFNIGEFPLQLTLFLACYIIFAGVAVFLFYRFKKLNYCWWLLLSPVVLNMPANIIRKDYLLFALFIAGIYLLRQAKPSTLRKLVALAIVVVALLIHEAFIFWGWPIFFLLLIAQRANRPINVAIALIPLALFGLLCLCKGSAETSRLIVDSWNSILPGAPILDTHDSSIGAIGWETSDAIKYHFFKNVGSNYSGIIVTPLLVLAIYYMLTNLLPLFSKQSVNEGNQTKLAVSLLFSLLILCLVPMLTILSCDTGRTIQCATVATLATLVILPPDRIVALFPGCCVNNINRLNSILAKILPPRYGLLLIMLLTIGVTPWFFSIYNDWAQSILGSLYLAITSPSTYF
ncbi:MAG: hypothetical protein K2M80_05635 [Muribaculaceae bacterium]|nr:hypothetical protein [Muribaculaceae bacterium]